MPAELRRGCAEKSMRGLRKMLAQTEAVSNTMPAWAITAVPRRRLVGVFNNFLINLTYDEVFKQRPSFLL